MNAIWNLRAAVSNLSTSLNAFAETVSGANAALKQRLELDAPRTVVSVPAVEARLNPPEMVEANGHEGKPKRSKK